MKLFDLKVETLNFDKGSKLIAAIVQHERTSEILLLGWQNQEAVVRTLESGWLWFYSRSRKRLWKKGETSGNTLHPVAVRQDCDGDALVWRVIPSGPACHTGESSCFGRDRFTLATLEKVIESRAKDVITNHTSYTANLLNSPKRILGKILEESAEVVAAVRNQEGQNRLASEAADLLYHLLVLLRSEGIALADVEAVLFERRTESVNA